MKLNYEKFLDKIFANLFLVEISTEGLLLDHIAYRATTSESYNRLFKELVKENKLLDTAIIRDREIAIFELRQAIRYDVHVIPFFELMAPAIGDTYNEGLEHAEFVIDDIDSFRQKYPKLTFGFKERAINSELVLKFENNANVKFHTKDIARVIKLQEQAGKL